MDRAGQDIAVFIIVMSIICVLIGLALGWIASAL